MKKLFFVTVNTAEDIYNTNIIPAVIKAFSEEEAKEKVLKNILDKNEDIYIDYIYAEEIGEIGDEPIFFENI